MSQILETMAECRRRAYVDCLMQMKAQNNVIGTFGNVDEAFLRAHGLVPIPIVGVDAHIFAFGEYPSCDPIRSTMVYLTTMKCPLLYSCKMYYFKSACPYMTEAFTQNTSKPLHIHQSNAECSKQIREVYGTDFNEISYAANQKLLQQIAQQIERLYQSKLSGQDVYAIDFYAKYIINLEERLQVVEGYAKQYRPVANKERKPVYIACPGGILPKLTSADAGMQIVDSMQNLHMTCNGCRFEAPIHIHY